MHIAFVTTESPYDERGCGIASYLRAIVPAIARQGHRISVFANARDEKTFVTEEGRVTVHHFRLPGLHWQSARIPGLKNFAPLPLRQLEWSRAFYRRVARAAAATKIDVIESTETGSLLLHRIAPLVIRLHGSELVFREHSHIKLNTSVKWNDALEAKACNRAVAISSPSKSHAREIAKRRRWDVEHIHVIPNPISSNLLNAAAAFHRNGHNERIVLYAGRLAPVKGIETLLKAAAQVRATDQSITFVLAGPWQMPHSPESYGLKNSGNGIRWIGAQDQSQLIDWFKRASVLVAPSNYETFGLTAVEGIAFGLPVVATDAGALSEILSPAQLVTKNDPRALADAIVARLAENCGSESERQHIFDRYAPARIAEQTIELYQQVAHSN